MKTISTPLEEQVPNLKTCKKLKEVLKGFGIEVKQSAFYWVEHNQSHKDKKKVIEVENWSSYFAYADNGWRVNGKLLAPAQLFTELWRLLPKNDDSFLLHLQDDRIWYAGRKGLDTEDNIAQAAAELVIWVAENHPEQLKQHLDAL